MRRVTFSFSLALAVAATLSASAGDFCATCRPPRGCRPSAWGMEPPCGDTGCGPRYWGPCHDDPCPPDPCDGCNRWFGCNGARQGPDLLAPWQLTPGRGFMPPETQGYIAPDPCSTCTTGPLGGCLGGCLAKLGWLCPVNWIR
jgi:hypothetical protein